MDGGCEEGYEESWNNIRDGPKLEYLENENPQGQSQIVRLRSYSDG